MKVTLFGLGYVGSVTATCLAARGHDVVGVDTDPGKVAVLASGKSPVVEPGLDELVAEVIAAGRLRATTSIAEGLADSDLSLVCVGTPSGAGGATDLELRPQGRHRNRQADRRLDAAAHRGHPLDGAAGHRGRRRRAAAGSASGRKVGDDLQVAMCPEFLREGSSVTDFFEPPFLVIGGSRGGGAVLTELFAFLSCPVETVPLRAAESIKYACNAFHAVKVSFANELRASTACSTSTRAG